MNLNLISFPSVHPFQNPNFYPEKVDGSHPIVVFKDENTSIIIKCPEMIAEIVPHFFQVKFPVFGKNNLRFYNFISCEFSYTVETLFKQLGILSNKQLEQLKKF